MSGKKRALELGRRRQLAWSRLMALIWAPGEPEPPRFEAIKVAAVALERAAMACGAERQRRRSPAPGDGKR